jgi:hypothetical protein
MRSARVSTAIVRSSISASSSSCSKSSQTFPTLSSGTTRVSTLLTPVRRNCVYTGAPLPQLAPPHTTAVPPRQGAGATLCIPAHHTHVIHENMHSNPPSAPALLAHMRADWRTHACRADCPCTACVSRLLRLLSSACEACHHSKQALVVCGDLA